MGLHPLVPGDGVDPLPDRAVLGDAVPHELEVVGPGDLVEGGEVHQDLAVDAEMEQQADVGLHDGPPFLGGQLVGLEHRLPIGEVGGLHDLAAVELVQELLDVVQAHDSASRSRDVGSRGRRDHRTERGSLTGRTR